MSLLGWWVLSGAMTAVAGLALGAFVHPLVGWATAVVSAGGLFLTPRDRRTFGHAFLTILLSGGVLAFLYWIWWERFL